jgi:hypothetical protein
MRMDESITVPAYIELPGNEFVGSREISVASLFKAEKLAMERMTTGDDFLGTDYLAGLRRLINQRTRPRCG